MSSWGNSRNKALQHPQCEGQLRCGTRVGRYPTLPTLTLQLACADSGEPGAVEPWAENLLLIQISPRRSMDEPIRLWARGQSTIAP